MADNKSLHLLFDNKYKFDDKVWIKVPTVREVAFDKSFDTFSHIFCVYTRELFAPFREIDELQERYPTIWEMIFDEKNGGDIQLGQMFGVTYPASALIMEGLSYWTGLDVNGFRKLLNGKIIHESGWILDKNKFDDFCSVIRSIVGYKMNQDLVPPEGKMSDRKFEIWQKLYKNRLKRAMRDAKKGGLANRIIFFQASYSSYVDIDSIGNMNYFHFNTLLKTLSQKEGYQRNWEVRLSPKYDTSNSKVPKHWSETIEV